jgi:hypothetical protein
MIVHPGEVIGAVVRGVVQVMPEPLRQRWTEALDTGRFDIRPLGPDDNDPGRYRFEAFLTDGGTRTSITFPVYDLAPFLDLPETPEDIHHVRHLSALFVDALTSGDLVTCSSMVSFDEGLLRGEQPIFSACSFERKGEVLWEGDHFEVELAGRDGSGPIRSVLSLWFDDAGEGWSIFRYHRDGGAPIEADPFS